MKIVYRHWRFDYDPETGITEVHRRSRFYTPWREVVTTGTLDGYDSDLEWVWCDIERFPTGLSTDQFLDALDDLAAGRFLS